MRVLRVVVRDFLSYADLDLDLSVINTAAVVGKNGQGKSSLAVDIITFGLWGKSRAPVIAKNIRDGADEAMVRIIFEARGDEYTVTRNIYANGRGNSVSFLRNGEDALAPGENKAQHTMGEIQDEIDRVIGLDYDAAIAGPVMVQDDSGNLIKGGPSKGKDLLISLFGVKRYEAWHTEAKVRASAYAREAADFATQVEAIDNLLMGETQVKLDLANARMEYETRKAENEVAEGQVVTLRERQAAMREKVRHAETLRQSVEQLSSRIKSDKDEYNRQLRAISTAHQAKDEPEPVFEELEAVDDEAVKQLEVTWREVNQQAARRQAIATSLPPLAKELLALRERHAIVETVPCHGEGIYATCRFLTSAPSEDDIEAVRVNGAALKAEMEGLPTADVAEQAYQTLEAARAQATSYEREKMRRESALAQWRLRVDNAQATVRNGQASLERLTTQIERDQERLKRASEQLGDTDVDHSTVNEIEMELRSLNDTIEETKKALSMLYEPAVRRAEEALVKVNAAKEQRSSLDTKMREANAKAETYGLLAKAFHRDGIPTLIIENGIPLIEEQANEILGRMPDNYRVRMLTQREKKGGMMDRLSIVVETNGKERDYAMLSGGERFRIDFALRIALSRVLAHRVGSNVETLIIDEGFGSQDDDGVEAMLESLAAVQDEFGLVLVVTHQKPVIERFQTRIEVSRDEDGSHAVLVA